MDFDYSIEKLQQEIDDCDSGDEEGWKQRMLKEKMAAIKKANNEMREKLMEQVDEIILRQNISALRQHSIFRAVGMHPTKRQDQMLAGPEAPFIKKQGQAWASRWALSQRSREALQSTKSFPGPPVRLHTALYCLRGPIKIAGMVN